MFSVYSRPVYSAPTHVYPAPPTARERYLAAVAQAQAAEQEYLAAEALEREEQALRLRLAEIEASRRQRLPQQFYACQPPIPGYAPISRPPVDRLELLRRQLEEEERQQAVYRAQEALQQERRAAMSWQQQAYQPFMNTVNPTLQSQPQDTLSSVESYLKGLLGEDVCVTRRQPEAPKTGSTHKPVTQKATSNPTSQVAALESYLKDVFGDGVSVTVRQPAETSNTNTKPVPLTSKPEPAEKAPKVIPQQDPISVMRAQLAERFSQEKAGDVKDAIQSIFSALGSGNVPKPKPSPVSINKAAHPAPVKKSPVSSRSSSPKPEPSPVESHRLISTISTSLEKLVADFSMPSDVDFVDDSNRLAYTPTNAPIRVYEQALTGLLTQLDGVDSFGDDVLRKERKAVVERVEERLDALEKEIEARWKADAPVVIPSESVSVEDAPKPVAEDVAVVVDAPSVDEGSAAGVSPVEDLVHDDIAPYDVDSDSVVISTPEEKQTDDVADANAADSQDAQPIKVEVNVPAIDEPASSSPITAPRPATPLSPTRTTIEDVPEDDADVHSDWSEVEA